MPAVLSQPAGDGPRPAVLLLMEAFGVNQHLRAVAVRLAEQGYSVLTPNLYYRTRPGAPFDYDQLDAAMAMMYALDLGAPMAADLAAALAYLKAQPAVDPARIGITGFCLGGGLTFMAACKLPGIAAAACFYGRVLDEWIEAIDAIAAPLQLFFGGLDPFIPPERVAQIEARLQALGKDYQLTIYEQATHGFFCEQRSSYHPAAAAASWTALLQFFEQHLGRPLAVE
jgi:carboxymethylenebutenolidase